MIRKLSVGLAAAILVLTAPHGARAQGFERYSTGITDVLQTAVDLLPEDVTNIRLGLGPSIAPDYEGSDDYNVNPVPVVSLRYKNFIEVDNNEVKLTAFNRIFSGNVARMGGGRLRAGPLIALNFGRGEGDSDDLRGMGKVGTSLELGAFVSYAIENTRVRVRVRQDVISGHDGATIKLDVTQIFLRSAKFALGGVASSTWASAAYMKSYFGVTAAQAAASGYPAFRAGSGFKDVFFGLNGNYAIASQWSLVSTIGYARLLGDAADSPIVSIAGSPNQFSFSSFIVYSF
jgi:outer membrane protein